MNALVAWVLSALIALSPYRVGDKRPVSMFRYGADATADDYNARMTSIAEDAVAVVRDAAPLPGLSKAASLRLMLSVAFFESGFARDVDFGTGKFGRGDFGRSWCLMQIQVGKGTVGDLVRTMPDDMKGWTGDDLVKDRRKCFRAGFEMLRRSIASCSTLKPSSRLSAYATGKCDEEDAKGRARWVFSYGRVLGRAMPPETKALLTAPLRAPCPGPPNPTRPCPSNARLDPFSCQQRVAGGGSRGERGSRHSASMTPSTFSNAIVATVGAYAELVSDLTKQADSLAVALRATNARVATLVAAARRVTTATDETLAAEIEALRDLVTHDPK
jgi:hypothetical protein